MFQKKSKKKLFLCSVAVLRALITTHSEVPAFIYPKDRNADNADAADPDSYPIVWTHLLDCFVVRAGRVMQSSGDYSTLSGLYPQCIYSPGAAGVIIVSVLRT